MDGFTLGVVIFVVVVAAVAAVAAVAKPKGSDGDPGEVVGDGSVSTDTGASWGDRQHAGGAEDRPAGPGVETMDPDDLRAPATERPQDRNG